MMEYWLCPLYRLTPQIENSPQPKDDFSNTMVRYKKQSSILDSRQ